MYESLHNHTVASDGGQTYTQVLEAAEELGFGTVAFTDHDVLPDDKALRELVMYDGPVKWLIGCEISSGLPNELGGGPTGSLHVLGLFTDPDDEALLEHCRKAVTARGERMERTVANLKKLGFKISVEECMQAAGGSDNIGRPHIVKALFAHPENDEIIDRLKTEMEEKAKTDAATAMAYMRLLERDRSDYPYQLFLSPDAYLPEVYVDYLYTVDFDSAVKLIRDAGGIAILAHWFTIQRSIDLEMLEGMVRDGRIDGIEIMGKPDNGDAVRAAPDMKAIADRTGCAITYGIDGHSLFQMRSFAGNRALAEDTVGQTAELIKRFKPSLDWTNFPEA